MSLTYTKGDRRRLSRAGSKSGAGIRGDWATSVMEVAQAEARATDAALKAAQNAGKAIRAANHKKRKIEATKEEPWCKGCDERVSDCMCNGGADGVHPETDSDTETPSESKVAGAAAAAPKSAQSEEKKVIPQKPPVPPALQQVQSKPLVPRAQDNKERVLRNHLNLVPLDGESMMTIKPGTSLVRWRICDRHGCTHPEPSCGHIPDKLRFVEYLYKNGPILIGVGDDARYVWLPEKQIWVVKGGDPKNEDDCEKFAILPKTISNIEMSVWKGGGGSPFDFDSLPWYDA
jgi:hypothetical protein